MLERGLVMKKKTVIRHFSMPKYFSDLINTYADETGRGYSEFIREAVRYYVRYLRGGGKI